MDVMDYIPVPSLAILVSVVLVLSCGQTDRQTESHTDADDRRQREYNNLHI